MGRLKGKTVVITGASSGIGEKVAYYAAEQGATPVLVARSYNNLVKIADTIKERYNITCFTYQLDVSNVPAVKEVFSQIYSECKVVDVLVNNAGTSAAAGFENVTDQNWEDDINLKLMAAVRLCRLVLPIMKEKKSGSIINAAIGGGKDPNAASIPTTVTRAAGINLTKSLSNEFAPFNIRVNAICIGLIKSAQWERRAGNSDVNQLYEEMSKRVPMGKVGEEIDYANLVAFLSSDRSAYITGTAINVDGGLCPVV